MLLGVYWFCNSPEGLYKFDFFKFHKGLGGFANKCAELEAFIFVENSNGLVEELEEFSKQNPCFLHVKQNGNFFSIQTFDYFIFDYTLEILVSIERQILRKRNSKLAKEEITFNAEFIKNFNDYENYFSTVKHNFIQIVSSDVNKDNSQVISVRIDCNLLSKFKNEFINELVSICEEENINVFYFYESEYYNYTNLMLFFTNGRLFRNKIINVNIESLEDKIFQMVHRYNIQFKHLGDSKYYPIYHNRSIKLMVDQDYIL
ncbi:hypothetical protein [Capnocytophaga stomatis]|uniref:Uncharacterized protein n=1 Tax=Capnocytophaga stomatis TaxID=1848904 RepID=A0ABW8Q8N0_9FLAO|nr:hypothetical protein [Capnocytophaga stomatis]GIJ93287.1 hypothetical protein CAPN002_05050 [Capnocytophaga stomatis]GIJ96419.1 hypothetical protein CAPN001_09880 [Capnocytophaga stomatis]